MSLKANTGELLRRTLTLYVCSYRIVATRRDPINVSLGTSFSLTAAGLSASYIRSTHWARDGPGGNGSPKYWVSLRDLSVA